MAIKIATTVETMTAEAKLMGSSLSSWWNWGRDNFAGIRSR